MSDEVYRVFNRQLVYSKAPLKNRLEATDTDTKEWTREKISFDAAYENTRVTMYLFLPRNASPPFQLIVTFPGLSAFAGSGSSDKAVALGLVGEAIIRTGRAVLSPVYKGSYERWDPFLSLQGEEGQRTWRQRMLEWRADLGRALDVAASRDDINIDRVAYLGTSFGASVALPLLAVEDRFKAVVLLSPGIGYRLVPPEADPINYVSHITKPVLMIGGRQDYVLSLEEQQKPLFNRLGTPPADRRHVVFDAGHVAGFPRAQTIRETLAWLDRYLGQPSVR